MTFDINSFMQQTHAEVPDPKYYGIPEGEYTAQIGTDPEKSIVLKTGTSQQGRAWARADFRLEIADPTGALKATHGDKPTMFHGVMLDLTPDSTADAPRFDFAKNRNRGLGALLKAAGVAHPNWKWAELYGKTIKIKVGTEVYQNEPRSVVVSVTSVNG